MPDSAVTSRKPLVVLPTYNERDNIASIVAAIFDHVPHAELWIVDDNSPDGTGELADQLAGSDGRIKVMHRPEKLGLGTAYVEAYRRALQQDFDAFLQMDADFSHDPSYLPQLLSGLEVADLVLGSRYVAGGGTRNWSRLRQIISQGGNLVARVGLGIKTRDATGGYRAFRRATVERLRLEDLNLRGYGFQVEVVYQVESLGLCVKEIPIIFEERVAGRSKMSRNIVVEAFLHIARRRWERIRGRGPVSRPLLPAGEREPVGPTHD